MSPKDYYAILGISREASEEEIKKAYRRIAHECHPDKNPGDKESEERFKEASQAYQILSNPEKRAQYDRFGTVSDGGFQTDFGGGFGGFADLFDDFFGDVFGSRRRSGRPRPQQGADLRYNLSIDFNEAVFGAEKKIKIPRHEECRTCSGTGAHPDSGTVTCSTCQGQGEIQYRQGFITIARTCSACHGEGSVIRKRCEECYGEGRIQTTKELTVKIPAGIPDGARLRISGGGEAGSYGGPPGDLYVDVSVKKDPIFERDGDDLYCKVLIPYTDAVLGGEIEVPILEGKRRIKIPAGTPSGKVLTLKGEGVPSVHGRGRGDLHVRVDIDVPTKLDREEKRLLKKLAEIQSKK